jgi:hypothetical protein
MTTRTIAATIDLGDSDRLDGTTGLSRAAAPYQLGLGGYCALSDHADAYRGITGGLGGIMRDLTKRGAVAV